MSDLFYLCVCVLHSGCKCCEMLVCRHSVLMSKAKEFLGSAVELELLPMLLSSPLSYADAVAKSMGS